MIGAIDSTGRAARVFACLGALVTFGLGATAQAQSYSAIACDGVAGAYEHYTHGAWSLRAAPNLPMGDWARSEIEAGGALWNSIVGATDEVDIASTFDLCEPDWNVGYGLVAWDDGTCYDWWPDELAVNVKWYETNDCQIGRSVIYFNLGLEWTVEEMLSTAAHELGHHQLYDHNWYAPSVMGYSYWGTPPMTFLSAEDHAYQRDIWGDGAASSANLQLHRFVLLDALGEQIIPDEASFDMAPTPTCSSGCTQLRAGHQVSVILTYENTGASATSGPVDLVMRLGEYPIGAWELTSGLPAHSWTTYEFVATVPESVPAGNYELQVWIDPLGTQGAGVGPSTDRVVRFPGFTVRCDPVCTDNTCASDGCGGTCGTCPAGGASCAITDEYTAQGVTRYRASCSCADTCAGAVCGDNGCGGSCGTCSGTGEACVDGACTCTPACEGKTCGPDGCGGVCGDCPGGPETCVSGACPCQIACGNDACAPNGCGGTCGTCSPDGADAAPLQDTAALSDISTPGKGGGEESCGCDLSGPTGTSGSTVLLALLLVAVVMLRRYQG